MGRGAVVCKGVCPATGAYGEGPESKERIERIKNNPAEQDLEVRKRLKVQKPGETSFILPETPKNRK